MRLPLLAALLCLLLPVVAPVAVGAVPPAPATASDESRPTPSTALPSADSDASTQTETNESVRPENTTLTLYLQPDGNARWTVTAVFVLDDDNETRAFDRLADDFEAGDTDTTYDSETFERAAAAADVDREMEIRDVDYTVSREARENVTVGSLTMELTWTNFARVEDDRIVVGDVFNTSSGTWFPGLARHQEFVLRPPEGYNVNTAPVAPRNSVLRWEGPTDFESGYLEVVYERARPPTTSPPGTTTSPGGDDTDLALIGLVGAGAIGGGALGLYVWFRRRSDEGATGEVGDGDEPPVPPTSTEETAADGEGAVRVSEDGAEVDPDLLSDEERVEYLLRRNGGRMKQANIVKETGWSNAKVSQLLSQMADEDRVDKLRIGRENLISLPDEDVAEFDEQ